MVGKQIMLIHLFIYSPDVNVVKRIYADVFVAISRKISKEPIFCETPKGSIDYDIIPGLSPHEMKGLSGFDRVSPGGSF